MQRRPSTTAAPSSAPASAARPSADALRASLAGVIAPGASPGHTIKLERGDVDVAAPTPDPASLSTAAVAFPEGTPNPGSTLPIAGPTPGSPLSVATPSPGSTLPVAAPTPGSTIATGPPAERTQSARSAAGGPGFRILREIGKGGMGVVYAAEQGSLGREVALKMVLPSASERAGSEQRFAAEAVVTGRLDHPNIVSVHDLGRDPHGSLYISMKLVRGVSWQKLLHPPIDDPDVSQRAAALATRDHLDTLLRVCDAVAFAHSRGIVHRDLKPENVMVGEFGEILVMDWGLALDVSPPANEARRKAGDFDRVHSPAGTPRYMAPEQALGELQRVGMRTDVYLLGAILFEILTGEPPHRGSDVWETLSAAMVGLVEPATQRAPHRQISSALSAIASKALEFEVEHRHSSVIELAQAVREFLRNEASMELAAAATAEIARQELVIADPGVAPAEVYGALAAALAELRQAEKLWAGNRVATEGIVRGHLAYAAAAIEREDLELAETELGKVAPAHPRRVELARAIEAARKARAKEARKRRRLLLALAGAVVIALALVGFEALREAEARSHALEARLASQRNLARLFHEMGQSTLANAEARTAEMLFARSLQIEDRKETREGLLRARNSGAHLTWASTVETGSTAIAYAPDGSSIAIALADGTVTLLDASSGKVAASFEREGGDARSPSATARPPSDLAFSPDGRLLAAAGEDGVVRVLDVKSRKLARTLEGHEGRVWDVAWSPDGARLASCGEDRYVRLYDAATGATLAAQRLHGATVYGLAYRPGSNELISASWDSSLRVWDAATLAPLREVKQPVGWMFRPVFTSDGKRIITGNDQTTITVNDADTGALVNTLRGHDRGVEHVAISPDGQRLLTGSGDHTVRVWGLDSARVLLCMRTPECETQGIGVAWSPDGRHVALAGFDDRVSVWDLEGDREVVTLRGHDRAAAGVRWSPDGKLLASSAWDKTIRIWEASGKPVRTIAAHDDQVEEISWGALGKTIASGGWDKTVRLFDARTGERLRTLTGHESWIPAVDLSPDERTVASCGEDGTVRTWDTATGAQIHLLRGHVGGVLCVAISPDGKQLVSGGADRTVRIWDMASGAEVRRLEGHTADVEGVAWSPDGKRLATGSWDETAAIWDAETGRRLQTLKGHEGWVYGVSWSRDGKRLASASEDTTARVWDVESGKELLKLSGHMGEVQTCAFRPDGEVVATASYDATVKLWSLARIQRFLDAEPASLASDAEKHTGLRLDGLDPLLATGRRGTAVSPPRE